MSGCRTSFARTTGRTISASFTRPNDTNQYTAGDVICNSTSAPVIMTFSGAVNTDFQMGIIAQATLIDSANQSTKLDAELWLFDTTVTMDNDNAAFTPTDTECGTLVGIIPFSTSYWKAGDATSGAGGNAVCHVQGLVIPFNVVHASNALYGILVARNAYTPVAQEVFTVRLHIID